MRVVIKLRGGIMIEITAPEEAVVEGMAVAEAEVAAVQIPEPPIIFDRELLKFPLKEARDIFEKRYLEEQLKTCNGKVGNLAAIVGMERTHLYRKLKDLNVQFNRTKTTLPWE